MIKILVTGAKGQLGKCIQDEAKMHPQWHFTYTDYEELDITVAAEITALFKDHNFDYCINCAAYTAVDKAEEEIEKCFRINTNGAIALAQACKKYNCTLIHISTDFVFNGALSRAYTEQDRPDPLNQYGASKLKAEESIKEILQSYFIIRTSWVYSEYGHNFLKTMLRLSKEKDEISVVNDQIGAPTYARDLAAFILFLILNKRTEYGLYHFSNKGGISWYDFAKEIFKLQGAGVTLLPISTEKFNTLAKRPKNSSLDTSHTQKIFNISIADWERSLVKCLRKTNKLTEI